MDSGPVCQFRWQQCLGDARVHKVRGGNAHRGASTHGIENGAKSIEKSEKKKKNRRRAQLMTRTTSKSTNGARASPFNATREALVTTAGPATIAVPMSPAMTASITATPIADLEMPAMFLAFELLATFPPSFSRAFTVEGDFATFSSSIP